MTFQRSHGRLRAEPERADELSDGVPAPPLEGAKDARRPTGQLLKGASTVPSMGGRARKGRTRLSHRIDTQTIPEPYRKRARALRRAVCRELARTVGGGVCGIIPSLLVKHAAVATALAEQALDENDHARAVKFAEASRIHLVFARETAAKDAAARPREPWDPLGQYMSPPDALEKASAAAMDAVAETEPKDV